MFGTKNITNDNFRKQELSPLKFLSRKNIDMDLLVAILFIGLIILIGVAIIHGAENNPTWTGIIVSALLGMLVFYLILCFFGIMGEKRKR